MKRPHWTTETFQVAGTLTCVSGTDRAECCIRGFHLLKVGPQWVLHVLVHRTSTYHVPALWASWQGPLPSRSSCIHSFTPSFIHSSFVLSVHEWVYHVGLLCHALCWVRGRNYVTLHTHLRASLQPSAAGSNHLCLLGPNKSLCSTPMPAPHPPLQAPSGHRREVPGAERRLPPRGLVATPLPWTSRLCPEGQSLSWAVVAGDQPCPRV